jgi:RNA-binding protein Musashi
VGGLPRDFTDEKLRACFLSFGSVIEAIIINDKKSNKGRGFGFVTFASKKSTDKVISKNGSIEVEGKIVDCILAVPSEKI